MLNGYESMKVEQNDECAGGSGVLSAEAEGAPCQAPKTTTIGTIALQSGNTRLVIALLRNGEWLQLKVLEVEPQLTKLGASPQEATEYLNAHNEVLLRLQSKQSPVEELLRQADQLISTQKSKAQVYKAMAETLGNAWTDVNSLLERRKQILDSNVLFQCQAEECREHMRALEMACNDTLLPIEIDAVKNFLGKIHNLRKNMLEALMGALQEGKNLLDNLKEISNEGTCDSRPEKIKADADHAILQVEKWLEDLHDRRRWIEVSFRSRKTQLEQCLALALLATDLRNLEDALNDRITALANSSDQLGDSASSARLLLFELKKLQAEAKDFQDRAIKITKSTQRLVSSGHFAGEQATEQAYAILGSAADYINDLDQYEALLNRTIMFFESLGSALTKLDQLEIQLVTTEHTPHSAGLVRLHAQAVSTLDDATTGPLTEGHALLEITGRGAPGAEGVKRAVEELEDRKIRLLQSCTAQREENMRASRSLNDFLQQYEKLLSWLSSIVEAFLRGHQDMGSNLLMAKDFYRLHLQLLEDLQKKAAEVERLDRDIIPPEVIQILDEAERRNINEKIDTLRESWLLSKKVLETRLRLGSLYVDFHQAAAHLETELDNFEADMKKGVENPDECKVENLEQKWSALQPQYSKLVAFWKRFLEESEVITDSYLDIPRARLCVETIMERFSKRQFTVTESWENCQTMVAVIKERRVEQEKQLEKSTRTLERISQIDQHLYPVIASDAVDSNSILRNLKMSQSTIIPEMSRAIDELDSQIQSISRFEKSDSHGFAQQVKKQLSQVLHQSKSTSTEYRALLESLISIFEKFVEIEKRTEEQGRISDYSKNAIAEIRLQLERHEISEQTTREALGRVRADVSRVVERINKQEPPLAARQDVEKLGRVLDAVSSSWENSCREKTARLEKDLRLTSFAEDLEKIDFELRDLSDQLGTISGWLGESLVAAKGASEAFFQFEKTLKILEQRITVFIKTSKENVGSDLPRVERELNGLRDKLEKLKSKAEEARKRMDSSVEYFKLLEEAREWFKEGSKLLIVVARKATCVKSPEDAKYLLQEIDSFLKPGEDKQEKRIELIRQLSTQVFGTDRLPQFTEIIVENREMLDSFAVVSSELRTLIENLKNAQDIREKLSKEQDEADAKMKETREEMIAAQAAVALAENVRKNAEKLAAETLEKAAEEAKRLMRVENEVKARQVTTFAQTESSTNVVQQVVTKEIYEKTEIQKNVEEEKKEAPIIPLAIPPQFTVLLSDATIPEGERLTFECEVVGNPEPEVGWYKDGMSIATNLDYLTSYDRGVCTLTIEETFAEDSARFICRAKNEFGSAETGASLTVKEVAPEEQQSPPMFVKELQPSTAVEGSTHRLECTVTGNPLPTVQWFKNDANIDNSPDYATTYNNGEAVLTLEEVCLENQGTYICKATNRLNHASTSAFLSVEPARVSLAVVEELPRFAANRTCRFRAPFKRHFTYSL